MVSMFASVSFGSAAEWWTLLKGVAPWMCGCFTVGLAVGFVLRRYLPLAILAAAACGLAVAVSAEWTSGTRSNEWSPEYPLVSILYLAAPFFVIFVAPAVAGTLLICSWFRRRTI
jgi:hypothetical protein